MNFNQPYYPYNYQPQMYRPPVQPQQPNFLQGKVVDSIDVVKSIDTPLDGSTSYYPIYDGTAIITKQLQMDGTMRLSVYKPIENETTSNQSLTVNDIDDCMKKYDYSEKIDDLMKQIEDIKKSLSKKGG